MARLDDIPKKEIFSTPDDYFDKLPGRIQSRIATAGRQTETRSTLRYGLRLALPVLIITAVVWYYKLTTAHSSDPETILASVDTEELIIFLQESGMTMEEVLDNVQFTSDQLEAIENEIYHLGFQDNERQDVDAIKED